MKFADIIESIENYPKPLNQSYVTVDGEYVWDYKDQGNQLRLIHENVEGSKKYPKVKFEELAEFNKNLELVSESTGDPITSCYVVEFKGGECQIQFKTAKQC